MLEKFAGCRVAEYTTTGTHVQNWGVSSKAIENITIDALDRVFLADGMDRVLVHSLNGTPLGSWGAAGTGKGYFFDPVGVATYGDNVYVVDGGNARVQRFSYTSSFAYHPYLTDVTWTKFGASLRVQMGFDNPGTEVPSLPFAGSLVPQIYGAFLPS